MASCNSGNAKMMPQGSCSVSSGECGLGYGCGVSYHCSCNWPAFRTMEKDTLCSCSQTRRIMLMIPPQTKVLDLFTTLTCLACPIIHVTRELGLSLSDLAAFHRGRKTQMSFFVPKITAGVFILEMHFT